MQAQSVINKVRRELLETVGAFWSDAELLDLINEGELDFHNKIRLLESTAIMSTVVGRANYPLPKNWLSDRAMFYNNPNSTGEASWSRLRPSNLEKEAQENQNFLCTSTEKLGIPKKYWIWGDEVYFYPVPSEVSDIYMFFKSIPVALSVATEDINTMDCLTTAIESYVLWKAWRKEKEVDLAAAAAGEYTNYLREGRRLAKLRSGDQRYKLDIDSPNQISLD